MENLLNKCEYFVSKAGFPRLFGCFISVGGDVLDARFVIKLTFVGTGVPDAPFRWITNQSNGGNSLRHFLAKMPPPWRREARLVDV